MKRTVFVKRYPSKGELPKVSGEYDTSMKRLDYFIHHEAWRFRYEPEWWIEEIELPSEQEITKAYLDYKGIINNPALWGANFILNKLK